MEWLGKLDSLGGGAGGDAARKSGSFPESEKTITQPEKEIFADEEVYQTVVDKMKKLYDTEAYTRTPEGAIPEDTFRQHFAALYAPSLQQQVVVEQEEPEGKTKGDHLSPIANYDTALEEHIRTLCQAQPVMEFKIFRYRHLAVGCLEAYLRFSTDANDLEMAGRYEYSTRAIKKKNVQNNPQITKTTLTRFALAPKVPGQVSARPRTNITKSTSERAFGRKVHELPSAVQGKLLGAVAGMRPVLHSYEFLRITMRYTTKAIVASPPRPSDTTQRTQRTQRQRPTLPTTKSKPPTTPRASQLQVIELWENTTGDAITTGATQSTDNNNNSSSSLDIRSTAEKEQPQHSRPYAYGATFVHTIGSLFAVAKNKKWPTFTLYGNSRNSSNNNHDTKYSSMANQQPIARMEQHSSTGFTIFGTVPLVTHPLSPSPSRQQQESVLLRDCRLTPTSPCNMVQFHPWLKLDTRGTQTSTGYLIIVHILTEFVGTPNSANFNNDSTKSLQNMEGDTAVYEPLYKVHVLKNKQQPTKSDAALTTRIEDYYHGACVAIVQGDANMNKRTKDSTGQFRVDIAPGVDPAMILCIVACLEELKQKGMK